MDITAKAEKVEENLWLIVELENSLNGKQTYHLVNQMDLVNAPSGTELHTGKVVNIRKGKHANRKANVVILSEDKQFLETELQQLQETARRNAVQRVAKDNASKQARSKFLDEEEDYSLSDSDWNPNDCDSADSEEDNAKRHCSSVTRVNTSFTKINGKSTMKTVAELKMVNNREMYSQSLKNTAQKLSEHLSIRQSPGFLNAASSKSLWSEPLDCNFNLSDTEDAKNSAAQRSTNLSTNIPPMTFDQQTQTVQCSNVEGALFSNQSAIKQEISALRMLVEDIKSKMESMENLVSSIQTLNEYDVRQSNEESLSTPETNSWRDSPRILNETNKSVEKKNVPVFTDQNIKPKFSNLPANPYRGSFTSFVQQSPINSPTDMVAIGVNKTLVPRHIYSQINWSSHTQATRKLLMACFPRRILATHSMTGKSSPAFSHKPAKMCLDRKIITDIIMTVTHNCGVQESQVRSIITTKCADENKMSKMRQERMKKKLPNDYNQENQSPETFDDL